jgi:hypothetical protein
MKNPAQRTSELGSLGHNIYVAANTKDLAMGVGLRRYGEHVDAGPVFT